MFRVSEQKFESYVSDAIDSIPQKYFDKIQNIVFVVENNPSKEQLEKLRLNPGHSLFGLYEGIPLPARSSGYNLVLPDKITIFKNPIENFCKDLATLRKQIHKTVWHEVAHYFGLSHEDMDKLGGI